MPVIFISYRRSDSQDVTGRIYDRLVSKFDKKRVFRDVDNIPLGISFALHLQQMLGKSGVVLVIIGPGWSTATDEQGRRRLDDPNDFVRVEVETALRAGVPVVPVLVSNARMPLASELPKSIRKLVSRHGSPVRPDPDFNNDINRLFSGIERWLGGELRIIRKPPAEKTGNGGSKPQPARGTLFKLFGFLRTLFKLFVILLSLSCITCSLGSLLINFEKPPFKGNTNKEPGIKKVERPTILDCTGPGGADAPRVKTAQQEWANYLKLQVVETFDLGNGVKLEMILVPPGRFMMGAPDGENQRLPNEKPHEVELTRPYYLAKFPVTQEQYQQVLDAANRKTDRFPVVAVNHEEAKKFCQQLAKHGRGQFNTFRLPTEAEWEYACRAGTRTPFHFGAILNGTQANCKGEDPYGTAIKGKDLGRTCEVGQYAPNALGLYDMHGNVWQWCQDWYGDYDEAKRLDPTGTPNGSHRVGRGGSHSNPAWFCRAAVRLGIDPVFRGSDLGFRPALVQNDLDVTAVNQLQEQLLGEWLEVKHTFNGADVAVLNNRTMVITRESTQWFEVRNATKEFVSTSPYSLDATKNPAVMSFAQSASAWIVKIEGDMLTICFRSESVPPPSEFVSPPNTQIGLMHFTRVKK